MWRRLAWAWDAPGSYRRAISGAHCLVTLAIIFPVCAIVEYAGLMAFADRWAFRPCRMAKAAQAFEAARLAWQMSILSAAGRHWYIAAPIFAAIMVVYFGAGCAAQTFAYRKLTELSAPVAGD